MGKVGTEATLKNIWAALHEGKMYIKTMAQQGVFEPGNIIAMKNISDAGFARKYFNVGDQVTVDYEDSAGNVYEMPWDIVHIGDAVLSDGSIKKDAIYLQSHYATVESIQFDKQETEIATEETATEGVYYYGYDGTNYTLLNLATGAAIPYTDYTAVYHNAIKDTTANICKYGYNRATHAAYPQWLNSAAGKGEWWTSKHIGDVAPDQANTVRGFLAGLPKDFVDCMSELKITQALNTVSEPDKTLGQESYTAKVFLPSLEQMYAKTQIDGVEGEAWDYYKMLAGGAGLSGKFQWNPTTYDILISYGLNAKSTAYNVRLGSASRGNSYNTWRVGSAGYVNSNSANYAYRCRPACVI